MNDFSHVFDALVREAPVERASWEDVLARVRRPGRRRGFAAVLVAAALILTTAAVAVERELDRAREQRLAHDLAPDDPDRVGPVVEIAATDGWSLLAWRSSVGVCVDFVVVPGKSPWGCDWPVRGAKPEDATGGSGPPTHAVAGTVSGGGLVGSDGKSTVFGVAAHDVASVRVELASGRTISAAVYDSPPDLGADLRFFVVRVALPPTPLWGDAPVAAFLAYDQDGDLIERVPL